MTSICLNCETPFIKTGPYFTCGKCHGPCDTFRYANYTVDETYYDATHNRQKDEHFFGNQWDDTQDLPFQRRVPKPQPSASRSLKKTQASDQFRMFGYRMLNFCSRYCLVRIYNWDLYLFRTKLIFDFFLQCEGMPIHLLGWQWLEIRKASMMVRRGDEAKLRRGTRIRQNRTVEVRSSLCNELDYKMKLDWKEFKKKKD